MSKQMSPSELARRKRLQADLSIAGGTLGLTALGAKGTGAVLRRAGKTAAATKLDKPVVGLLTGGAGIGGVGAFNFAATQKAEAAGVRPKMVKVSKAKNKKSYDSSLNTGMGGAIAGAGSISLLNSSKKFAAREAGLRDIANIAEKQGRYDIYSASSKNAAGYGELKRLARRTGKVGIPVSAGLIGTSAYSARKTYKNNSKIKKAYDPERNRRRRADVYTGGALVGSGVGSYTAGKKFASAGGIGHLRQAKNMDKIARGYKAKAKSRTGRTAAMNRANDMVKYKSARGVQRVHVVSAGKIVASRPVMVPLAATVALAGSAGAIQRQKKNSGRTYTGWYDGKKSPKKPRFSRVDNTTATSN